MITAASNARIKRLIQLNQKARLRREEDVFVAEGVRMFLEAPPEKIKEVYVSERFLERCSCRGRLEETGYEVVADSLFEKISDTCTPQGILCVMGQSHYNIEETLTKKAPLLLALENIQDPGNLGTMLRTGEGAGVDGVLLSSDTADLYNPKVIRSTMGSIFRVPFFRTKEGSREYTKEDYRGGTVFVIGNEGNGLTKETAELADVCVRIPMEGQVESLNAAVSSALLLYEAKRQRGEMGR